VATVELSDYVDNGYALSLNLAILVGREMRRLIAAAGWDLPSYQGNDAWVLPIPATFVVGTDGSSRRASSILTIVSAWPSTTCWEQ
jgi:hypothetical protein